MVSPRLLDVHTGLAPAGLSPRKHPIAVFVRLQVAHLDLG